MSTNTGSISDGYHTFDELYTHRHVLFLNVVRANHEWAFKTWRNKEGEAWEGWFILGLNTPYGQITYHLPKVYWDLADVPEIGHNAGYDGHNSNDVVERLTKLLSAPFEPWGDGMGNML